MPTAIERRLRGDDVSAAFGFLCGRDRGHYEDANAYGADPHGRFVGARLSFAF